MNHYRGQCHCGKVQYEVDTDLVSVIDCNCSYCSAKGLILTFVAAAQFRLLSGGDDMTEYRFNTGTLQHLFCRHCGVQCIGRGTNSKTGSETVAINVRTLTDVDLSNLTPTPYDGRSR